MSARSRARAMLGVSVLAIGAAACESEQRPMETPPLPQTPARVQVVTSDLVAGEGRRPEGIPNPYVENEHVIAEGERLYNWMNCAGCHGPRGGGGIGPPFSDGDWIYGGEPGNIFQSVVQGRPNGMPTYAAMSDDQVWKIVAYVRSLGPVPDAQGGSGRSRSGLGAGESQETGGQRQ